MQLDDVRRNYDRAAKSYDRWNRVVWDRVLGMERLRTRTIERLGGLRGGRVLDIGCGTGLNFPLLVDAVGPEGTVVGVDYSEGMLERAQARIGENGWSNVVLRQGDAAALDGLEGTFDGAISTWAMGIVHDLPAALNRAIDLLARGGRLAILDFEKTVPDRGLRRWFYPLYHQVLLAAGFDEPEDLDDGRQRRRWSNAKALLRARLIDVKEEPYSQTGLLITGRRPPHDVVQ